MPTDESGTQRRSASTPGTASTATSGGRCGRTNAATARASARTAARVWSSSRAVQERLVRHAQRVRAPAVDALRPVEQGGVAARPHVGDDLADARQQGAEVELLPRHEPLDREDEDGRGAGGLERRQQVPDVVGVDGRVHGDLPGIGEGEHRRRAHARQEFADRRQCRLGRIHHQVAPLRGHHAGEHQLEPLDSPSRLPSSAPRPATSTACDDSSVPTRRSPFALAVEPVETRSTIASANPSRGAASTDPDTGTSSASTPRSESSASRDRVGGRDTESVEILDRSLGRPPGPRPRACSRRSRARRA